MPVDLLMDGNQPPVGARGAEPLTLAEIDAHPDGNRIWATILGMRESHQGVLDKIESDQIDDWEAERKEHDQEVENLHDEISDLENEISDLENELSEFRKAA
jgi:chromosome segregation ATPase